MINTFKVYGDHKPLVNNHFRTYYRSSENAVLRTVDGDCLELSAVYYQIRDEDAERFREVVCEHGLLCDELRSKTNF